MYIDYNKPPLKPFETELHGYTVIVDKHNHVLIFNPETGEWNTIIQNPVNLFLRKMLFEEGTSVSVLKELGIWVEDPDSVPNEDEEE